MKNKVKLSFISYTIRSFNSLDAAHWFALIDRNRTRLKKYFPITVSENETLEASKKYLQKKQNEEAHRLGYTLVITDNETDALIGVVILKKIKWTTRVCELAYFIDENYEGKGVTSAAVQAIIVYAKEVLEFKKIGVRISTTNIGSVQVAKKNGFIWSHCIANGHRDYEGNLMDVEHYELTL